MCDMSRVGVLGQPKPALSQAVDAVLFTNRAVSEAVRAGDLHRLGSQTLERNGYEFFQPVVGRGIGRDVHGWPYMLADSDDTLEAGMTIDVEIELRIQGVGCVNIEDMVLVTEDGSEPITTLDPGLYMIGDWGLTKKITQRRSPGCPCNEKSPPVSWWAQQHLGCVSIHQEGRSDQPASASQAMGLQHYFVNLFDTADG